MAAKVTGVARATLSFVHTPDSGFFTGQGTPIVESLSTIFRLAGVTADECDIISPNSWTFVASTPQTKDLQVDLKDVQGNTVIPVKARLIAIRPQWQSDVPLLLGGAAANEWDGFISAAGILKVFPSSALNDGWTIMVAPQTNGIPITSTSKALKFDPQTAAGVVDFIFAGCSA